MDQRLYWIWMQQVFGYGTRAAHRAMEHFHPRQLFEMLEEERRATGLFSERELERLQSTSLEEAEKTLARAESLRCNVLTQDDGGYPQNLRNIYSPPCVLYCCGSLKSLKKSLAIAVIGPRKPSDYAKKSAQFFSNELARAGAVIVSGLAVGVDGLAHQAAVGQNGTTIGVLGCGLDIDYPVENNHLKRQMVDGGGAVISEYPFGTRALPYYFPARNRLISGLAQGVLVIEATLRSGTLITAGHAVSQNRDVFVVPGDIFSPASEGIMMLLRQGAKAVASARDILEEYGAYSPMEAPIAEEEETNQTVFREAYSGGKKKPAPDYLSDLQRRLYEVLTGEPAAVNQLTEVLELPVSQVLTALTELEIYGLCTSHPGRRYSL